MQAQEAKDLDDTIGQLLHGSVAGIAGWSYRQMINVLQMVRKYVGGERRELGRIRGCASEPPVCCARRSFQ